MDFQHQKWSSAELLRILDPNSKFEVHLTSLGASIVKVLMPNNRGEVENIIFGQNSPEEYGKVGGYMGASVGRVANRIKDGSFELLGQNYQLAKNNNGIHCLHGGTRGFSFKKWDIIEIKSQKNPNEIRVTFEYISPDGEENFPGTLTTRVTYFISPMKIQWEFFAFTDKPTIVNLTNHTYWNLESPTTTIANHELCLNADRYSEVDDMCLPTGEISSVENTGVDFRTSKNLEESLKEFGDIDNNFFFNEYQTKENPLDLLHVGELRCRNSGRIMQIATSEPCIQVYTGNFMSKLSSYGTPCIKHNAICLETQRVPNAINFPEFRDQVILKPGDMYIHKTQHKFEIII